MAFSPRRLMRGASGTSAAAATVDAQFNYVTMLLHGNGTNGAQNNTFLDSSTNNFSITRNGNTTQGSFSPYGSNWSNYFNGSNNLNIANNAAFTLTANFTIECWFFQTGAFQDRLIISKWPTEYYIYTRANGVIGFAWGPYNASGMFGIGGLLLSGNNAFALNTWTHVAVVRNSNTFTLYVNGVSISTATYSTGGTNDNTPVTIGDYSGSGYGFQGYISNARIVKGTAVYTSNFTPSTTPLTAITNTALLTCQSNRFIDNSTNNFSSTITGSPSVQRFNPFGTSTAYDTSVIGGSGYFDGSGDYLQVGPNTALGFGTGDFTVEAWVYPISSGSTMVVADITLNIATFYVQSNQLKFFGNNTEYASELTVTPQAWNHVVWVRNSGQFRMYVNGVGNSAQSVTTNFGSSEQMRIGVENNSYWYGYISNLRVVKGTAVYTANFTPPTAPVTAISGTSLLTNFTNGAIFDNAMMNDLETVGNAQISTSLKKFGTGSMLFDGDGDWLKAPNSPNFDMGSGNFTIEGWFYQTATGGQICAKYEASYQSSWAIGFDGANWDVYTYYSTTSNLAIYTGVAGPTLNTWNHFALERNGSNIEFYLNGSRVAQVAAQTMRTTTSAVAVGNLGQGYSSFFTGYIDDIRITKGYARYSGTTYTMPTLALSDTGPI